MKLPDGLRQGIYEWFDALHKAAYNEELEWMVEFGMTDQNYDPEETSKEELRKWAGHFLEPAEVVKSMLDRCERSALERAIIEVLFEEKGFVKCVRQYTTCTWQKLYPPSQKKPKKQISKKRKAATKRPRMHIEELRPQNR